MSAYSCGEVHEAGARCELGANHRGWHQETRAGSIYRWSDAGSEATYYRRLRHEPRSAGSLALTFHQVMRDHRARLES